MRQHVRRVNPPEAVNQNPHAPWIGLVPTDGPFPEHLISNKPLKLRLDEAIADPEFCDCYFATPRYVANFVDRDIGGAVPGIDLGILKSLKIALPALAVQREIARTPDAIVMRPKAPRWKSLLVAMVSSDAFIAATAQGMKEGSKMPRADWKQMKSDEITVPSQRVLEAFNAVVEPILEQCKTLALQSRSLRAARDPLLPRLMSGELTV